MSSCPTALVVDDEASLLGLMARVLEKAGYQAHTATDVTGALEVFRAHVEEIDLVLLDVQLAPTGGAADLLPEMLAAKPDLRVMLTSGDSLPDSLAAELERIGGHFLRKPFVPKALLRLVGESERTPASPGPAAAAPHGLSDPGAA